jgi:hypothetical protein
MVDSHLLVDSTIMDAGVEQRDNLDRGKLRAKLTSLCQSRAESLKSDL